MRAAAVTVLACGLLLSLGPAARAGAIEIFGGWEGDTNNQGYGFTSVQLSGELGPRFSAVFQASPGYLYYEFPEGLSNVRVKSPGVGVMAGARLQVSKGGSLTLLGGVESRWNTEEATDQSTGVVTKTDYDKTAGQAQGLFYLQFHERNAAMVLLNYGDANRYLFSKAVLKRRVTPLREGSTKALSVGVDLTGQGNDDVQSFQVGGIIELGFVKLPLQVGLRAGYKRSWFADNTSSDGPFAGADFYMRFP